MKPMPRHSASDHVRPLLKDNTLFGGLPDGALDALIGKGHIKKYAKGDVIYRRGAPGDSLMVILIGRIKITNINVDGKEVVLNFLGAGDINGEIAVIDGKERTANAQALEDLPSLRRLCSRPLASPHGASTSHAAIRSRALREGSGRIGHNRG